MAKSSTTFSVRVPRWILERMKLEGLQPGAVARQCLEEMYRGREYGKEAVPSKD